MKRILCLDYGEKRIGLALSDPLKIIAYPYKTIINFGLKNLKHEIKKIIASETVESIVIGLPIGLNGKDTIQTQKVREFRLQILDLNIPIYFEDERLSSLAAAKSMKMEKIKTGFNKGIIDKRAAAIILQQFLDKKKIIK
ncbi:MAG: Holliday junction resolvase RuvX [Candidatus Marinimicrobia bacterium]|nr:Holliday junction resolvase RuvX [Candidatus Neomarinimicrobiota bacterium]